MRKEASSYNYLYYFIIIIVPVVSRALVNDVIGVNFPPFSSVPVFPPFLFFSFSPLIGGI